MQTYAFLSSPETLFSLTANFLDDRHIWTFGDVVSSRSVCGGEEIGVPGFPQKVPCPGVEGYPVPTAASAFTGSKGTWERPLVALSCIGIWGPP